MVQIEQRTENALKSRDLIETLRSKPMISIWFYRLEFRANGEKKCASMAFIRIYSWLVWRLLNYIFLAINLASTIWWASALLLFRRHRSLIRKLSNVKRVRNSIEYFAIRFGRNEEKIWCNTVTENETKSILVESVQRGRNTSIKRVLCAHYIDNNANINVTSFWNICQHR